MHGGPSQAALRSQAWHSDNGVVAPSARGSLLPWQRTPTTNPFLTNSKKIRRSKRATNTHKHGRKSYLSVGTGGDVQTLLKAEPLRSKDRGLFTYNIDSLRPFHLLFSLAPSLSHIIASSLPPAPCSLRPSHLLLSLSPSLPLAARLPPAMQRNIHRVCIQCW